MDISQSVNKHVPKLKEFIIKNKRKQLTHHCWLNQILGLHIIRINPKTILILFVLCSLHERFEFEG